MKVVNLEENWDTSDSTVCEANITLSRLFTARIACNEDEKDAEDDDDEEEDEDEDEEEEPCPGDRCLSSPKRENGHGLMVFFHIVQ